MPIINERWPSDLPPVSCDFGRRRFDVLQRSPRTQATTLIVQGRPLWSAELTWRLPNDSRLAKLRRWLDGLAGHRGSVQIWNFGSAHPYFIDEATGVGPGVGPSTVDLTWTHSGQDLTWIYSSAPLHWQYDAVVSSGPGSAGSFEINLRDLEPEAPVTIAGQHVQIGRRLYVADAETSSDANGEATVALTTPLIRDVVDGETVRLVEAACEMHLASQDWTESATAADGFRTISAPFIETVEDFS